MLKDKSISTDLGIAAVSPQQYQCILQLLSPRQVAIITLYYEQQKKIADIAAELNLGYTTVAHQRRVALHIFRKELDPGYKKQIDDVKNAVIQSRLL